MKKKRPMKSMTIWFAIIVAVLSVLQGFVFYIPIDPRWQCMIGVAIAIAIVLLRFRTKEPIYGE
jgi:ABC-type siderophore export system fused ATPase/permease subunit